MILHVRKCPGCREERSAEEVLCGNCTWDLTQEPLRLPGQSDPPFEIPNPTTHTRLCSNGHPLDPDDEMCFKCGATVATEPTPIDPESLPQDKETALTDGLSSIDWKSPMNLLKVSLLKDMGTEQI